MEARLDVVWTQTAIQSFRLQQQYLELNWSRRQVLSLEQKIKAFEMAVARFPELYPVVLAKTGTRKAILMPPVSILYQVKREHILVIGLIDNRQDPKSLARFG